MIFIMIASLFLGIGYASISDIDLEIEGTAQLEHQNGAYITDITYIENQNANMEDTSILDTYQSIIDSKISLSSTDSSSYVSYSITLSNQSADTYVYTGITYDSNFYDNENIQAKLSGISLGETIDSNQSKTFTLTYSYIPGVDMNANGFSNVLNGYINLNFKPAYKIAYSNISGSGYPTYVIKNNNENTTLTVDFSTNAPTLLTVTGTSSQTEYVLDTDYTYVAGVLTFTNVQEDLTITNAASGGSGTEADPYIVDDTEYNPSNIDSNTEDGYYSYDNVEGSPTILVEDGEVVEYTLTDTVTDGDATNVDTGVEIFDGTSGFEIEISFNEQFSQESTYDKVISIISDSGSGSTHSYSGLTLFYYVPTGRNKGNYYLRTQSFTGKSALTGSTMSGNVTSGSYTDVTITSYYSATHLYYFKISKPANSTTISVDWSIDNGTITTQTLTSQFTTLEDATVIVGGASVDSTQTVDNMEILSFSVKKTS